MTYNAHILGGFGDASGTHVGCFRDIFETLFLDVLGWEDFQPILTVYCQALV